MIGPSVSRCIGTNDLPFPEEGWRQPCGRFSRDGLCDDVRLRGRQGRCEAVPHRRHVGRRFVRRPAAPPLRGAVFDASRRAIAEDAASGSYRRRHAATGCVASSRAMPRPEGKGRAAWFARPMRAGNPGVDGWRNGMTRFDNESFTIRRETFGAPVPGLSGWRCKACDAVEFDPRSALRHAEAGDALVLQAREHTQREIHRMRKKPHPSQVQAARLTGGGHNAFMSAAMPRSRRPWSIC